MGLITVITVCVCVCFSDVAGTTPFMQSSWWDSASLWGPKETISFIAEEIIELLGHLDFSSVAPKLSNLSLSWSPESGLVHGQVHILSGQTSSFMTGPWIYLKLLWKADLRRYEMQETSGTSVKKISICAAISFFLTFYDCNLIEFNHRVIKTIEYINKY